MFFVRSHAPACSPNTIPNSPSRATIGGAGLFNRITPYVKPTSRPTTNEMSSAFIFKLPSVTHTILQNFLLSIRPVETEYLLRSRLSGSHPDIRVHGVFKRNDLNRRRFQSLRFKTRVELVFYFRCLSWRQSKTVYSKQPGEIVIEVDEVETDAWLSGA